MSASEPASKERIPESDPQLDGLRTEEEYHLHHARGDIGGKYHDQEGDGDQLIRAAERAKQQVALGVHKESQPVLIIVMGVSGCGKSTIGAALAHAFDIPFVDADNLHPQSNIDKMSSGVPLTDADRQPWLERVREEAVRAVKEQSQSHSHSNSNDSQAQDSRLKGIVVGCSALKRSYRDVLRGFSKFSQEKLSSADSPPSNPADLPTYFVHIRGSREDLLKRMVNRKGHFMKAGMLDSQLQTLEPPEETGEPNVVKVDLEKSVDEQIEQARNGLRQLGLKV